MKKPKSILARIGAVLTSAVMGSSAVAQSGDGSTQNTGYIEEIVVTAQKREQTLQETPVAVTVFSGQELAEQGADDLKSIMMQIPGIAGWSHGGRLDSISVRGVTTNDYGNAGDTSIGLFLNGIWGGLKSEAMTAYYDLERVEVLKGPQSLLFGRGAASGAVSVVTTKADPTARYGEISLGGGERDALRGSFMFNAPVSDKLAVRFAGTHSESDGFVTNGLGGPDLGFDERDAFRFSANYGGDVWNADLVVSWEDRESTATIYNSSDPAGVPLSGDLYTVFSDQFDDSIWRVEVLNISLELSRELEIGTLTLLTGYRDFEILYHEDLDGTGDRFLDFRRDNEGDYFSQEIRLVSRQDQDVTWFFGGSVFTNTHDMPSKLASNEDVICSLFVGFDCATVIPGFTPTPSGYLETGVGEAELFGYSVFGDLRFQITEKFAAGIGLRYNYDEREFTLSSFPITGDLYNAFGRIGLLYGFEAAGNKDKEDWSAINGRALLEYEISNNTNLYFSVSKGYKPGGFDSFRVSDSIPGFPTAVAPADAVPLPFDPESLWSYEIGLKGTLGDGRFSYALAAYDYDYEDLQQLVLRETASVVVNIGEASGQGIEAEFVWYVNEYVDVRFGAARSEAEIDEVDISTCIQVDGISCEGNQMALSPDLTGNVLISGRIPLSDSSQLRLRAEVVYSDSYFTAIENAPVSEVDSFTLINYRASYIYNENIELSFFLENATDKKFTARIFNVPSLGVVWLADPMHPRTYGVDFTWRFGAR